MREITQVLIAGTRKKLIYIYFFDDIPNMCSVIFLQIAFTLPVHISVFLLQLHLCE
jgi:hypothetical protein